jgi:hypothetical protein
MFRITRSCRAYPVRATSPKTASALPPALRPSCKLDVPPAHTGRAYWAINLYVSHPTPAWQPPPSLVMLFASSCDDVPTLMTRDATALPTIRKLVESKLVL